MASSRTSFGETFKEKRRELGPGKTFTWQGKKYSTDRKEDVIDPMDDLAPPGNLPLPVRDEEKTPARPPARPPARHRMTPAKKFAKGGMVRGGGCETKGKTKGRFV